MKAYIPSCVMLMFFVCVFFTPSPVSAEAPAIVPESERCAVCGMFVAKYPNWVTQVQYADGTVKYFDGVKDLMVHHFDPSSHGGDPDLEAKEIWVKDYYSLAWIDGRSAVYVTGSDVFGPMGKEFVPFAQREAAENFFKEHGGKKILAFAEITTEMVEAMRSGHKMKGHMMKK